MPRFRENPKQKRVIDFGSQKPVPKEGYILWFQRFQAKNVAGYFKNATSRYVFGLGWH